ncbi:MAG: hypothetical protein KKG34_01685 [Proteobacteria bacterium]|nr:hypothetical protein [Pseudomonadota bacterium]MBU4118281.1 hypothetical protein [Pseudomonadota bacterium]
MRCPKCGYISFDRQRTCGKCSNSLTALAEQLDGTTSKAVAPFFLGGVLGRQESANAEPDYALDEEETLRLDELENDIPQTDEDDLDFAGTPLDEDEFQDQPLPSLGLEDIDMSDLMPPQEEQVEDEEEPVLSLGDEREEAVATPVQDEEDALMGIELPSLEPDTIMNVNETENLLDDRENEATPPPASAEDDEIIDLSSLMSFDEPPPKPAATEEDHDMLELSLDDGEHAPSPEDEPKKPANTMADIPDLGLTLENDDK